MAKRRIIPYVPPEERSKLHEGVDVKSSTENKDVVGKFVIVMDLNFSDYMKDKDGKICVYDTFDAAANTCGMYEFDDALVLKVMFNHVENE